MNTTELVLTFVAPAEVLSINKANGMHWARRSAVTKQWRDVSTWQAIRHCRVNMWSPSTVQVRLPFETKRERDGHNYTGTVVKAIVDGLVNGGLWPTDTPEWVTVADPELYVVPKGSPLLVTVTVTPR